jgi:hypothetical protein
MHSTVTAIVKKEELSSRMSEEREKGVRGARVLRRHLARGHHVERWSFLAGHLRRCRRLQYCASAVTNVCDTSGSLVVGSAESP